ncbi:MAG: type III pantothenate kinase [Planctomycetaceae bacterium]|jgi:pantothenate kinase type III|nr:type III pantothenate kinase [Planctomycetaceae bacterium]
MIAVDIGNTRAKFGYFTAQSLSSTFPEPASNIKISYNKNNIGDGENLFGVAERKLIADWLCNKRDVVDWYISVTASCCGANSFVEELALIEPDGHFNLLTNGDIPIISNVEFPAKTGIDRLLDAIAAVRFVGGKLCGADSGNKNIQQDIETINPSCLKKFQGAEHVIAASRSVCSGAKPIAHTGCGIVVVDAGTAVTVNMISVNNNASNNSAVFEGGVILAGLRVLSVALNQVSSKLPEVGLEQFQSVDLAYPAKNTESAIMTGILGSLIAAIDFFVKKSRVLNPNNIAKNLPIIFTGGDSAVIGKLFAEEFPDYNLSIVPELTLIGIAIAASENDKFLS